MDKVYLGPRVSNLDTCDTAVRISRVNLLADSEHMYTAGDDSGRTFEKTVPWASQAMADSVLASLRSVEYRPYSGLDGLLDPAAEVGDGITVGDTYSVLAQTDMIFDRHCTADVSAPGGDELEDEYPYKSRARRQSERDLARVYSSITKTSERITLLVANEVEGLEGKLSLTASSLTSEISSTRDGLNSKIEQTASSLSTRISNAQGDISSLQQTATSLSTRISSVQGDVSSLQQTTNSLSFTASSHGQSINSLWSAVNGFSLSVSNGEYSSTLRLMSGQTVLSSADIQINGMVTFTDLSSENRYTVINGGNISTGTINANNVNVTSEFALWENGFRVGFMGCGYGYDGERNTWGARLSDDSGRNYLLAANSGVRMQDNYGGAIWVTGGNCFSSVDMMTYSDRRMKEDIDHDLECYQTFFRGLRPCRFLLKNNPAEGYHTGFVAQEVEEAMDAAKLSPMDFTGLGRVRLPDGTEGYALRYGAFVALNTYMIQTNTDLIHALEREVIKLKEELEKLKGVRI